MSDVFEYPRMVGQCADCGMAGEVELQPYFMGVPKEVPEGIDPDSDLITLCTDLQSCMHRVRVQLRYKRGFSPDYLWQRDEYDLPPQYDEQRGNARHMVIW